MPRELLRLLGTVTRVTQAGWITRVTPLGVAGSTVLHSVDTTSSNPAPLTSLTHRMRLLLGIFALLLLAAAVVQYNDPDKYVWIFAYAGGAVLCGAAALGKARWSLPFGWALGSLSWAVMIGRYVVPERMSLDEEEFRETCGLLLMAGMLLTAAWSAKASPRGS